MESDLAKRSNARKVNRTLPPDVATVVQELDSFLNCIDSRGRRWSDAKYGVYAFYDYDGEPIYVGQTRESLRTRIRRHLTNQRTDAVAMRVLDPIEVAEIEVIPFWEMDETIRKLGVLDSSVDKPQDVLNRAEFTLYQRVLRESSIGAVLNEKVPVKTEEIELPEGLRRSVVPDELRQRLGHPDNRMARRALKLAELANTIAQRDVSVGLRHTMIVQAQRLLLLSQKRFTEITSTKTAEEVHAEMTGSPE